MQLFYHYIFTCILTTCAYITCSNIIHAGTVFNKSIPGLAVNNKGKCTTQTDCNAREYCLKNGTQTSSIIGICKTKPLPADTENVTPPTPTSTPAPTPTPNIASSQYHIYDE